MNYQNNFQAIILAGGKGTRMGELDVPKVLVQLNGKPLLSYILQNIKVLDLNNKPIIVVGYKRELVEKEFGESYVYAFQEQQLGTAHAVMSAKGYVTAKNVLVFYGDMPFISTESIRGLMQSHEEADAKISMLTAQVPSFEGMYKSVISYGRIVDGKIVEFKDCSEEEKQILEVNPGIYAFDAEWLWPRLSQIDTQNKQGEMYLTDIVKIAMEEGEKVNKQSISPEEILGVNSLDDLNLVANNVS